MNWFRVTTGTEKSALLKRASLKDPKVEHIFFFSDN